ncbi:MAG TPA: ChbG/HpnK family deacetylase [Pirellulales bacterium]|nr:ChbG/HpnK family deacetylase [Pirellulales bacterium]
MRRGPAGPTAGFSPRVVLHADDLGLNRAVNEGILQSARQGLLTSASLLANAPQAAEALAGWQDLLKAQCDGSLPSSAARRRLDDPPQPFDLGIHVNLTQGRPLTADRYPAQLLDREGRFPGPGALFRYLHGRSTAFAASIEAELRAQIDFMLDHRAKPTHLNGHQYVEMMPAVAALIPRLVRKYSIPVIRLPLERNAWRLTFLPRFRLANACLALVKRYYAEKFRRMVDGAGIAHPDAFFGSSHAGCVDLSLVARFLVRPQRFSLAEIALHPGAADAPVTNDTDGWCDPLAAQRPCELAMLLSPGLQAFLISQRIKLGRIGSLATSTGNLKRSKAA